MREQGRAAREHGRAEREQKDETGSSGGAKRRHLSQPAVTCWPGFGDTIYIYQPRVRTLSPLLLLLRHQLAFERQFVLKNAGERFIGSRGSIHACKWLSR